MRHELKLPSFNWPEDRRDPQREAAFVNHGALLAARRQTDHGREGLLHDADEAMVDVDGQVTEDLPVLGQIKVLQAVVVLPRGVLFHELLSQRDGQKKYNKA